VRKNKLLLLFASLGTLLLLGIAAYQETVAREWRRLQQAYRGKLDSAQAADFEVHLRQVFVPGLGVTDRCISCHVGMAPGEAGVAHDPVFAKHPDVVHDPADYGCVTCHDGQGRATEAADAHGEVEFWPHPMLPARFAYAGCGSCHTHVAVPDLTELKRGQQLVERNDCLACHALDGRGGTLRPGAEPVTAPDLSRVGGVGYDREWYAQHLAHREAAGGGPWRTSFGVLSDDDRRALDAFLASRVGAPRLVEAKGVFHSLGCRGCHKIAGVGGDDGPDLTREGEKDPGLTNFRHVQGEHTIANWLGEHFRAPGVVVPGSTMPQLGLSEAQVEALTFYMLSLRRSVQPERFWPKDRIRAERFGEREFATDGGTLYGTFCAACHGPAGEGMRYPGMMAFPAIGNADFLAVASDRFLTETITHGRPGRRMPAWGDGGLRPAEIAALVAFVRSLSSDPAPIDTGPRRSVQADPRVGAPLYAAACASCHGDKGEGKEGPALSNARFLAAATDTYLIETIKRGRRGTSMPAFGSPSPQHQLLDDRDIAAIVSFVRTWEETR
jgi:mono/diheme cytochrome c family protein